MRGSIPPHKQAVEKPGVRKLADIKLMKEDPEGVEKGAEEIKQKLRADIQGVMTSHAHHARHGRASSAVAMAGMSRPSCHSS